MTGHIYIVRHGTGPLVKIGYATDVARRVALLQCGNPEPLTVLRSLPGDRGTEARFHARFASARVRGEWFTFDPAMLTADPGEPVAVQRGVCSFDPVSDLVACADRFCAAAGITETMLGVRALNDWKAIKRLRAGEGLTTKSWCRVMQWLSDHWPMDASWPSGVTRPAPVEAAAA